MLKFNYIHVVTKFEINFSLFTGQIIHEKQSKIKRNKTSSQGNTKTGEEGGRVRGKGANRVGNSIIQ